MQRELDDFRQIIWNNKKGRKQPRKALPNGKAPLLVYEFPETCEGDYQDHAIHLSTGDFESLGHVEALQPIFEGAVETYIPDELREILDTIYKQCDNLPALETLELENANDVYIHLRTKFQELSVV